MVGRKEGVCDCGKDGDPGHGVLERGNRVSITGKGGEERVVWCICIRRREGKRMRGRDSDHCNGGGESGRSGERVDGSVNCNREKRRRGWRLRKRVETLFIVVVL